VFQRFLQDPTLHSDAVQLLPSLDVFAVNHLGCAPKPEILDIRS
jgi:hypothetical protein